ncbi:MAG: TfoX/Sxy family protein [Proteobacteria bacterium]|nr:TfoX/Sxy family protein [Pseudomonadota bacterium]
MAKEYFGKLRSLLEVTIRNLPPGVGVEIKHFFSGAAAYANGRICISLTTVGLAMKLPQDGCARLIEDGARPLRYFPNAPVKRQYVIVPEDLHEDEDRLRFWARTSIDYALTLPRPKPRRRRKPES